MSGITRLFRILFLLLGLFEFFSAFNWLTNPSKEVANAQGLLPASVGSAGGRAFVFAWSAFLIALGLVRVNVYLQPSSAATLFVALGVHLVESGFFWAVALTGQFKGENPIQLAKAVANFEKGFFPALVLIGPLLLIVMLIAMLVETAASASASSEKEKVQ